MEVRTQFDLSIVHIPVVLPACHLHTAWTPLVWDETQRATGETLESSPPPPPCRFLYEKDNCSLPESRLASPLCRNDPPPSSAKDTLPFSFFAGASRKCIRVGHEGVTGRVHCVAQKHLSGTSQIRQDPRSEHDCKVNLEAGLEIRDLHEKIDHLLVQQWRRMVKSSHYGRMDQRIGGGSSDCRSRVVHFWLRMTFAGPIAESRLSGLE